MCSEEIILRKDLLGDLGVLMNEQATFQDHINKVCNTVNKKAAWILRTFNSRGTNFMKNPVEPVSAGAHRLLLSTLSTPAINKSHKNRKSHEKIHQKNPSDCITQLLAEA